MTSESKTMNFEELWQYQQGALFLKKDSIYDMRKDLAEYFYKAGQEQLQKHFDKAIEALKLPEIDCGDNSCRYADRSKPMGMRTNGGCRCFDKSDSRIKLQRYLVNARQTLKELGIE